MLHYLLAPHPVYPYSLKYAYIKIFHLKHILVNTVHDELVFECSADQAEIVREIVKIEMEKAGKLFLIDLPCEAKIIVSDTWGNDSFPD